MRGEGGGEAPAGGDGGAGERMAIELGRRCGRVAWRESASDGELGLAGDMDEAVGRWPSRFRLL